MDWTVPPTHNIRFTVKANGIFIRKYIHYSHITQGFCCVILADWLLLACVFMVGSMQVWLKVLSNWQISHVEIVRIARTYSNISP